MGWKRGPTGMPIAAGPAAAFGGGAPRGPDYWQLLMRLVSRHGLMLLLAAAILVAAFAGIARSIRIVSRSSEAVENSYQITAAAEKLLSLVQDVETGQRGYLLTGNPDFLAPYEVASTDIDAQLARLSALVVHDGQVLKLARIRRAVDAKLDFVHGTIDLGRNGNLPAALAVVRSGDGKARMDALRAEVGDFLDIQHAILAERRREAQMTDRRALAQALVVAMLTLVAGVLMAATTRRARAELGRRTDEAAEATRRFEATFDHAAVGIAHLAPDGTILRVNDQLCDISGYAADELVGRWFETITHHDDVQKDLACRRELLTGKLDRYSMESRCVRRDGSLVWVSLTVSLVRDAAGEPDFFVSVVKDIADRKVVEARLLSGEAQYRAIYDTAVEAIAVIDANGRIQSVNPALERIFGYAAAELVDRNISMLMPPAVAAQHDNFLDTYRRTGMRAIIGIGREVEGLRKDGRIFPLDLSVAEWESSGETFFTGIMRDISERKAAEAVLAETEARFRLTQEAVQAGVWETDLATHHSILSRESMRLFGLHGDEEGHLPYGEWGKLIDPTDRARARTRFDRAVAAGERFDMLVRVPMKAGGLRWIQMIGQPQYDDTGKPVRMIGLNIDVTGRRHTEQALRDSEERLRALQNEFAHLARVNELGELAAAIAHEINQPLTAITNYMNVGRFALDQMEDGNVDAETLAEASEVMGLASDQAVRAGDIVRRLREFVGKGTASRKAEDVDDLVDTAMSLSLIDAQLAGIIVERQRGAGDTMVEVEALQIQQVLVNLLRNAIDSLVQLPPSATRHLSIITRLVDRGQCVEVAVRDTGPGIAPEIRERLFEPFVTSKANGMGMGLSLSRRLIEAHGGSIDVQSAPGEGAAFRFRLPVMKADETPSEESGDG